MAEIEQNEALIDVEPMSVDQLAGAFVSAATVKGIGSIQCISPRLLGERLSNG